VADSTNCALGSAAGLSVGSPTLAGMTDSPAPADAQACVAPAAGNGEAPRRPALSPSRAADFKQCPLLYRFRAIDRLPELPSRAQVRGTLVHAVLERLYDLPAAERRPAAAHALVGSEWARLHHDAPELLDALFAGPGDPALAEWLASAEPLLDTYFRLEDPRRLEPTARELLVETELPSGLLLRGYVDRLDIAASGQVRIVDYKTGAAPRPVAEARALFQMKFYALVVLHLRGVVPAQLRLLYLTDGESLTYEPDEAQLLRFARTLEAIWAAILAAAADGEFQPNPSRFCEWCSHRPVCPAWGGQPPAYPGWPGDPVEETPADRAG
jgi:putative RecB family exonuclease